MCNPFTLIWKLAWRSLWRNKRRTWITLSAISLALGLAIFFLAWGEGVYQQMIHDAVRIHGGHFVLESPSYREAPSVDLAISEVSKLRSRLSSLAGVERTKALIMGQGVLRSSSGAVGIGVMGVEPQEEKETSPLVVKISEGEFLKEKNERNVFMGKKLSERLKVQVGQKVVLTTNNIKGELVEELLRVRGLFEMGAPEIDGFLALIPIDFARSLYGLGWDQATQVGALVKDLRQRDKILNQARSKIQTSQVVALPWESVLNDLAAYIQIDRTSNQIFQGIFIFLSLFTIFNTLLMSLVERTKEFAVMMALGAKPRWIKTQLLCESAILGFLGALQGMILGGGVSYWFKMKGIDLANLMEGEVSVSGFAIDTTIRPFPTVALFIVTGSLVFFLTIGITGFLIRRIDKIRVARSLQGG